MLLFFSLTDVLSTYHLSTPLRSVMSLPYLLSLYSSVHVVDAFARDGTSSLPISLDGSRSSSSSDNESGSTSASPVT